MVDRNQYPRNRNDDQRSVERFQQDERGQNRRPSSDDYFDSDREFYTGGTYQEHEYRGVDRPFADVDYDSGSNISQDLQRHNLQRVNRGYGDDRPRRFSNQHSQYSNRNSEINSGMGANERAYQGSGYTNSLYGGLGDQSGQRYERIGEINTHRGKGPKGYVLSDERLKDIVCERLADAPHIDASHISVEVKNKEVTLSGSVDTRITKHATEDLVANVSGVGEIHNQLKITSTTS